MFQLFKSPSFFSLFYPDYFKGPRLLIIMIPLLLVIDLAIWFLFHFNEIWLLTLTKSLLRILLKQLLATVLISANQTGPSTWESRDSNFRTIELKRSRTEYFYR